MSLEQQIAALNDNVGELVSKSDQLTNQIENKLSEYEDWKGTIHKPNPVILQVGVDKQFAHPVDARNYIQESNLAGDVIWRIEIDPGIYDFPYNGINYLRFSHHKSVYIVGKGENSSDVIFRYNGDSHHYIVIGEFNTYLNVTKISFKGMNPITGLLISQIRDRTLRSGMAGAGLMHGILCRFNSYGYIDNCEFNNLWYAIAAHDNCRLEIHNVNGTQLYGGISGNSNVRVYVKNSFLRGIGGELSGSKAPSFGVGVAHNSTAFCYGVEIRDFSSGLQCHWNSDFHFHRSFSYDTDGITKINEKFGHIENCYYGINCWYYSGGNTNYSLFKNIEKYAIRAGQSSNIHAATSMTVDGAEIGVYAIYNSSIAANHSTVKNCTSIGYYSTRKSELHAGSVTVSGNGTNYSPAGAYSLGNYDSYIYR